MNMEFIKQVTNLPQRNHTSYTSLNLREPEGIGIKLVLFFASFHEKTQ